MYECMNVCAVVRLSLSLPPPPPPPSPCVSVCVYKAYNTQNLSGEGALLLLRLLLQALKLEEHLRWFRLQFRVSVTV